MFSINLVISFVVLRLFIILSVSVVEANAEKLVIATGNYPPWSSENYKYGGFVHHIITEAFKLQGFETEYIYYPWARNYETAKKGKFHASAFWAFSPDKEKLFLYSNQIYRDSTVLFYLKSMRFPGWETIEDLAKYKIGITRGYTYTPEIWESHNNNSLNIMVNNSDENNFHLLQKKRLDLVLMTKVSGLDLLHEKFPVSFSNNVTFHPKGIGSNGGSLLFPKRRKDAEQLRDKFNLGLKILHENGSYNKYYKRLLDGYYQRKSLQKDKVLLCEEALWPPYTYEKEGMPTKGISLELMQEIFERLMIEIDFRLYPMRRCIEQMKKGSRDAMTLISKNAERKKFLVFSDSLMESKGLVYYAIDRKKIVKWKDFKELSKYAIGLVGGHNYGNVFNEARSKYNYKVYFVNRIEQNFQKLFQGRIDIILANQSEFSEFIRKNTQFKGKFMAAKKPYHSYSYHMAFSKKSSKRMLLPKINKVISEMQSDGTIDRILKKYLY